LTDLSSILSGITREGQTDGRTEFSSLYRVCITCSAVKRQQTKRNMHPETKKMTQKHALI